MRIDAERPRTRRRDRRVNRAHVRAFLVAVVTGDEDPDTIPAPHDAFRARPYIFGQE